MLPECAELEAYRLENDWTWEQLSKQMRRRRITMSPRTLHYLLKRAPLDAKPHDRTIHKIRLYLRLTRAARRRSHERRGVPVPEITTAQA